MGINKLELKKQYIPLCASEKLSIRKCAKLIGIAPYSVFRLKKRYILEGEKIFLHGNLGKIPKNKRISGADIVDFYTKNFDKAPFSVARNCYSLQISYSSFYKILSASGVKVPHPKPKKGIKHLPRKERSCEGELVQMDASLHDWFMNGKKCTLHGAIDDATHKIVALYFCENECLFGYHQLLLQMKNKALGFPESFYVDRSSCFFITSQNIEKVTIQDQIDGYEKNKTQFQKICDKLNIELIAAYSPQAKGRIERLWQTLQNQLPYIFRYKNIDTIEKANKFLNEFIEKFNALYSVPAQNELKKWSLPKEKIDYNFLLSVRSEKKTHADGTFIYHGYEFRLLAPRSCCVKFTLCLSENIGIKAFMNGKYYDVELCEPICDIVGDSMPIVEKNLMYKYFYADTHSNAVKIG